MSADTATTSLKHTPLHALHVELGARMVPFAGDNERDGGGKAGRSELNKQR
jgi:hypothetical protein